MKRALLEVVSDKCDECLFTSKRIVSIARYREVLTTCMKRGHERFFACHKTANACCRGFYDSPLAGRVAVVQIARRLGSVSFVEAA